ncbi:28S ribosomal protein S10, mitochondrial [Episyrphus balteatus]|uniref:28S ribosomal protein S10, mitochondrial n=1 Tax=Episyrphus balteatus TaxID=286459 RepID=UPI0024850802|nr:28S ribosomal protein S10, mitochondrial [Episyrphus balteatus]
MFAVLRNILSSRVATGSGQISRFSSLATEAPKATKASETIPQEPSSSVALEKDKLYTRLELELRGIDPAVLKSYSWFATQAANNLGIEVGNCWAPRKAHHDRITLLKSVHIYKKHRVQYEIRTHFRFLNFHKLTGSTLDTFLEYIERNLPEGVALQTTKVEIQEMPEHLRETPPSE